MKPLSVSPRYNRFTAERDVALEKVLRKYLRGTHRVVDKLKDKSIEIVTSGRALDFRRIEPRLSVEFDIAAHQIAELFTRLRQSTYALTYASEVEAIARSVRPGRLYTARLTKEDLLKVVHDQTPSGGHIWGRVDLALHRLKREVLDAIQMGILLDETPADMSVRITRAFPKVTRFQRPPRVLKEPKLRESTKDAEDSSAVSATIIDLDAWRQSVKDYKSDELPFARRSPKDQVIFFDVQDNGDVQFDERYEWEMEQEITQDFVQNVRDGQVDAANENGIDDFQWVSVIDDSTDDCCVWRDGLTSAEIEQALNSGDHGDDESDATVPPAHFNCRCKPVPMSKDIPDVAPPDYGSFDDWLNEKAAA